MAVPATSLLGMAACVGAAWEVDAGAGVGAAWEVDAGAGVGCLSSPMAASSLSMVVVTDAAMAACWSAGAGSGCEPAAWASVCVDWCWMAAACADANRASARLLAISASDRLICGVRSWSSSATAGVGVGCGRRRRIGRGPRMDGSEREEAAVEALVEARFAGGMLKWQN